MNINELFEIIQDRFYSEDLNGEFTLHGNCIIWEYRLERDSEELPQSYEDDEDGEDGFQFDFESESNEELLLEAYNEDYALIEELLDELDETNNWNFSEPDTFEESISFKIF